MKFQCGILFLFFIFGSYTGARAQKGTSGDWPDSVQVQSNEIIIIGNEVFVPQSDTVYKVPPHTKYHIKKNPYVTSEAFYKSLKTKTNKKKITREMYNLLIVNSDQNTADSYRVYEKKDIYKSYRDRRISKIYYKSVPMFEGNVNDTLKVPVNSLFKTLDKWHVNTRKKVIKSNLFFKKGDRVDPGQLADNERVLRQLPYIQDARIYVRPDPEDSTKVNVIIAIQDQFPWGVNPDIKDQNKFNLTVTQSNIAGLGFQAFAGVLVNLHDTLAPVGFDVGYRFDNIGGTFISGVIEYMNSQGGHWMGVKFEKQFLTPTIKWGGGLRIDVHRDDTVHVNYQDTVIFYRYSANLQDYWLGRSFLVNPKKRKRVIGSLRYVNDCFPVQPYVAPDSNLVFHDKVAYMGSIMLIQRDYYKTGLVFNYGPAEDIPHGFLVKLTGAHLNDEFFERPYVGMETIWAKSTKNVGYFGFMVNTGGFIYNGGWKDVLVVANAVYISPLSTFGKYKLRQIGHAYYTINASDSSSQFIKYDGFFRGLNEFNIWGKSALALSIESSLFTPWYFYGFRFVPFGSVAAGVISKSKDVFADPEWQGEVRLGLRIFNPSFVFNQFDISVAYVFNNGGNSSPLRFDFDSNRKYIHYLNNVERPELVYE